MRNLPLRIVLVLIGSAAFATGASSQPRDLLEGVHYEVIDPPVPVSVGPEQIEVTELFWYGCPKCSDLEPMMRRWGDNTRGDLSFRRAPAVWHGIMRQHARVFYAADRLGVTREVHAAAFESIQRDGNSLRTEESIRALFLAHGVTEEEFSAAWNAPAVVDAVQRAAERTRAYSAAKLPALIVNGRYRVSLSSAVPTLEEMVIRVNLLIKRLRDIRRPD